MAHQILNTSTPSKWGAAALLLFLTVASTLLLLFKLNINNAPEVYLPPQAPAVVFDRQLRETFPQDRILAVLFQGDDLYSDGFLNKLDAVVKRLEALPQVERVLALTTLDHIAGSEDGFIVEPLLRPGSEALSTLEDRRAHVTGDRFAPRLVVSQDGDTIALVVRPYAMRDSLERIALRDSVLGVLREHALEQQVVAVAGDVVLDAAQLEAMLRDSILFIPATTLIGLALIWWLYRRPLALVVAMLTTGTVVSMAVAMIALWGRAYTLVESILPPLLAALTMALLIHLFNGLQHASRKGYVGQQRVMRALQEIRKPAGFTALTTAAGLFSLGLSPIQPIQTFGIVAGLATLLLYPIMIGVLPSLLVAWDHSPWPAPRGSVALVDHVVRFASRLAIRRAGWVVAAVLVLMVLGIPQILKVEAETDLYKFFREDHPLTRATRLAEQALSGVTAMEVVFTAQHENELTDPQRLVEIREFQHWLEALPQSDRVLSMVDIIEDMHWAFHGEDSAYRVLPDNQRLIKQYLFIYDGRDLYDLVDRGFSRTRVTVNLNISGANEIQAVMEQIKGYFAQHPMADLSWEVAGQGRLFVDQEDLLIQGQVWSLWSALGLILLLMVILWRSLPSALLCMIPNISPILMIFSVMGLFGLWLDMATAIIASVAVGVAVDDTIHLYHGYLRRRQAGRDKVFALLRSYHHAGRAVTATTLILCAQLLMLVGSDFVPTTQFGLLTSMGLFAALLFDLLLLPAILILGGRGSR